MQIALAVPRIRADLDGNLETIAATLQEAVSNGARLFPSAEASAYPEGWPRYSRAAARNRRPSLIVCSASSGPTASGEAE